MNTTDDFIRELTDLSLKYGLLVEGACPRPPVVTKMKLEQVAGGRYHRRKSRKGLELIWKTTLKVSA